MVTGRKPILFACTQSTGLINSSLAVAGELSRRGVPDLYFASDDNRRTEVEKLGDVEFVSMGPVDPRYAATMWDDDAYRAVTQRSRFKAYRARIRKSVNARFSRKYLMLDTAVKRIGPALMVINNLCFHAVQLAVTRHIPFIVTAPFLPSDLCRDSLPKGYPVPLSGLPLNMSTRQKMEHTLFRLRMRTLLLDPTIFRRAVEYFTTMRKLGIDSRAYSPQSAMKLAEMILCFSLLELDYPFEAPDNLHTLGAMMPPLPETSCDDPVCRWLDAHESVVYVAFGTITRLTRDDVGAMVEVVRRLGDEHHVLWKLPTEQQRFLPQASRLPSNLWVASWLPSQFDVLAHPHVRAYFNHGGSNSFHEGLYFGKPLLVWPLWLDCYDHAVRARDAGVGLTVDRSDVVDVADVYPKLRRLLDESGFRERAEYMARLQRQKGGVRTAADLILGSRALAA